MDSKRGLVLDANILIRLVLGRRVRELVLTHADRVAFFTPAVCYDDARRYLPGLLVARQVDPGPALEVLNGFEAIVRAVDESVYASARADALARIERRDAQDWPILATADVGAADLDRGPGLLRHRSAHLDHRPCRALLELRKEGIDQSQGRSAVAVALAHAAVGQCHPASRVAASW